MSLSYQDPSMSHDRAKQLLSTSNSKSIISALISIGLNETDGTWAQNICIKHLKSHDEGIVCASITALGHIARRHANLEIEKTKMALRDAQEKHPALTGSISDTLDDIEIFVRGQ